MPASNRWFDGCKRLAKMDSEELRVRVRQEVAKHSDFVLGRIGVRFMKNGCAPWVQGCGRFFFWPEEVSQIVDWFRERYPEIVEEMIERAERICQHRFDLLGYEGVKYGAQIDWHLDAVHGKRAPRSPWFRIRYLDFNQVGDSKVTWELNRHQHLVTLARAYRLTAEPRYARELFQQWYHWQEQNPYGIGINWASSLEVAMRSLSWLWIWHLLKDCPEVPEQFPADLWRALALNARHIERFLSTYFSPNTHLLGEGVGLFFIGTLCPGSPSAQRWQKRGWQIVLGEALRQVQPDGMHFEQSIYYHIYALDFFLHARILAHLNKIPIPATFDRIIEKMLDAICALHKAGPLPRFGDDDGGRVFDQRRNRTEHLLDPLATGAVLLNRADFKAAAGDIREETVWLLGLEGAGQFEKLPPQQRTASSFALKSSGMYVMCSSNSVAQQLVIDAGPQMAGRAGHSHADALSVQLSANGEPLLIDPGTLGYVGSGTERNRLRGTGSHNTVEVDNLSQAEPTGPFGWQSLSNATVDQWVTSKSFDFFAGSHDGYNRLRYPVQHHRYVFYLKPCFWLIRDVLEGAGNHRLDVSWHFAPGTLSAIPGGVMFSGRRKAALALLFTASHECSQKISQGSYSPMYGKKEVAPIFQFGAKAQLPAEFATLLVPVSEASAHVGVFQRFESRHDGAPVRAYQYSIANSIDYLFFADQAGDWHYGPWASDARFLFCSTSSGTNLHRFVICDGSYLEVSGRQIFAAKAPVTRDEWLFDTQVSDLTAHGATATRKLFLLNGTGKMRASEASPATKLV
ncbi:MAG TPA: alginate lyase family protein [Terriglobales bacterium]|jgi:hypothetical protein|nr:alginate lyase family protein [Terriglobales bacterium]